MTKTISILTIMTALALTACGGGGGGNTDTTKPTISLGGPSSVTAAGSSTFTATASDASGIANVKFYRGSVLLGTDTTAPYEQAVTFAAADNGSQIITATAMDTAGNSASASQNVAVNIGGSSGGIITRLSGCTPVNQSSDPAASACLAGTYSGKTISNQTCSLTVRADGGYDYASPTLNYTYMPTSKTIRVFGYNSLSGFNQIVWIISDSVQTTAMYDLNFTARWGTSTGNPPVEIKATKDITTSSTCLVPLN